MIRNVGYDCVTSDELADRGGIEPPQRLPVVRGSSPLHYRSANDPYLMRERGFSENQTTLAALPFLLGMVTNFSGGYARDVAVRHWGAIWGPRSIGLIGLATAAVAAFGALRCASGYGAIAWLALCYGGITLQQPVMFSTCVDIGRQQSGAVVGCMNTAGALGGLLSSWLFGYLVQHLGGYDGVLLSMVCVLGIGAGLWLAIDATTTLASAPRAAGHFAAERA